jgi:hypothetical protein
MGQTTRSLGISFTHDTWALIEARRKALKIGRSQYFQMLVDRDLAFTPDIHAHKADGQWHFYPESDRPALKAAEGEDPGDPQPPRPRRRRP